MQPVLPYVCDHQERESAIWLEDSSLHESAIHQALVERYALDVYRLAWVILTDFNSNPIREEDLHIAVQRTFRLAVSKLDGFQGQESVRSWLFYLTIRIARAINRQPIFLRLNWFRRDQHRSFSRPLILHPRNLSQGESWSKIRTLTRNLRLVAYLRYAHRLTLPEIARVLEKDVSQIHIWLTEVREKLLDYQPSNNEPVQNHDEFRKKAHAFLDGILDPIDNRSALKIESQLEIHIGNSPDCRSFLNHLIDLEIRLANELPLCMHSLDIAPDFLHRLELPHHPRSRMTNRKEISMKKGYSSVREIVLMGCVVLIALAVTWHLIKQDKQYAEPLFLTTHVVPPTPVLASGREIRTVPRPTFNGIPDSNLILDPVLTADGKRVVYVLTTKKLVNGLLETTSQVKMYDQITGENQLISSSFDNKPGNGTSLNPTISADGRWIAFTSSSSNIVEGDNRTCLWENEETNCFDIFIRDMFTGEIQRISTALEGRESNGHSVLSELSPNGRWIAFWSFATNLTSDRKPVCNTTDPEMVCWNVYLRDIQTQRTIQLPIGRLGKPSEWPAEDILSLSDDGRWLTITIQSNDSINKKFHLNKKREVYVYDRELEIFESINLSTNGEEGNGDSFNASLTPDGRFVIFTSEASNLVEVDNNHVADVFIRDRLKLSTECISVSSAGLEGNHPSGVFPDNIGDWGTRSAISADGNQAIFFSTADNLELEKTLSCQYGGWFPCSRIYIRDRQRNTTQAILQGPQLNAFFMYPNISSDGRWISLVHLDLECPRKPICSVLLLQDQHTKQFTQFINPIQVSLIPSAQSLKNSIYLEVSGSRVNHLEISPDGKLLAAGEDDGGLSVWNIKDNSLVYRLVDHNLPVKSVAFSPDGKLLATGSFDGMVIVYRASDGTRLYNLMGNGRSISSLAFSPKGNVLSVGASGATWNLEANNGIFATIDYYEHSDIQINQIAYSPDGRLIAYAMSDNSVWLRHTSGGEIIARLSGSESKVLSVAFSPDGNYLASGSEDGRVDLWRLESEDGIVWSINNTLTLFHTSWVGDLDFFPDGKVLAVASMGSSVCLWQIPSGDLIATFLGTTWDPALSLAFTPDGKRLAVSLSWGGVRIWPFPPLQ